MHQPVDEPFPCDLPRRDARGRLRDRHGIVLDDAACEECKEPTPSPFMKLFHRKWRCTSCMYFWEAALKPKPSLRSALQRARQAGLPATLTEEQWQQTLEHFKHLCAYCGKQPWRCVEHAMPLPPGGTTVDNCVPSCGVCNALKRGKTLEEMAAAPPHNYRSNNWNAALAWLHSQGRRITTAEQARTELSCSAKLVPLDVVVTVAFRTRTVEDMRLVMEALVKNGHATEFLGRKRKVARTVADIKILREIGKQKAIIIERWP